MAAPPLLIPEGTAAAAPEPSRRPTLGLAIAGGALAILAGICITLLWEHRQRPRPLTNLPTVNTSLPGPGSSLVVEPLGPPPTTPVEDAGLRGPAMPQVQIPPIRSATGEDVTQAPAAPPAVPAQPGLGEVAKTLPTPTPAAPGPGATPSAPAGNPSPVGTVGSPSALPRPGVPAGAVPSPPPVAAPVAPSPVAPTPAAPVPTAAPPVAPTAAPSPAGPRTASRDEVDELLGNTNRPAPSAPAAPAPTAAPPVAPKPAPPQRPSARPAGDGESAESGDKTPEQLLEDAQAAYVRGERQRSIDLAMQVTARGGPNEVTKAWRFIGSAACSIRSSTLASRAYINLASPEHKQLLAELCKRNGLSLQDGQFVTE